MFDSCVFAQVVTWGFGYKEMVVYSVSEIILSNNTFTSETDESMFQIFFIIA